MTKFKVGDEVRIKDGWYESYTKGSSYNLPKTIARIKEIGNGWAELIWHDGLISPAISPEALETPSYKYLSPIQITYSSKIESGVYDRIGITIHPELKDPIFRFVGRGGKIDPDSVGYFLSVDELRNAAKLFNEIADYMDTENKQ